MYSFMLCEGDILEKLVFLLESSSVMIQKHFSSPAAKTHGPSHQVLHIILMVALHQRISSHYCSAEPPGIYYDKFL